MHDYSVSSCGLRINGDCPSGRGLSCIEHSYGRNGSQVINQKPMQYAQMPHAKRFSIRFPPNCEMPMPYSHLKWNIIQDPISKSVFQQANMYLFDIYGMLRTLPPSDKDGGDGNFGTTLVLLCVIDGLAKWICPTAGQEQRFKRLIRRRLPWGPEGKGKWVDKGNAADQLYTEFRNPLVHELANDTKASSRPAGYVEPVIGKWGVIPDEFRDIEKIDALAEWNKDWPILMESVDPQGNPRYKLTVPALYQSTELKESRL